MRLYATLLALFLLLSVPAIGLAGKSSSSGGSKSSSTSFKKSADSDHGEVEYEGGSGGSLLPFLLIGFVALGIFMFARKGKATSSAHSSHHDWDDDNPDWGGDAGGDSGGDSGGGD